LFVVGNGTGDSQRSNALTLYKNGILNINDAYSLPNADGMDEQVLVTDGAGNVNWADQTDAQAVDVLNLNGNTLEISLENNGTTQTVDLSNLAVPIGTIQMWPTDTPPDGWLICDGDNFDANTYPELNTILGSTTLPDFRRRFPLGAQDIVPFGETARPLNSTGGEEEVTLTVGQLPSHNHGAGSLSTQYSYLSDEDTGTEQFRDGSDTRMYKSTNITGSTASTGSGQAHNNMPPYYAIHFIIKAE